MSLIIGQAEASDELPAAMVGEPIVILNIAFVGGEADAERILAPVLSLGAPLTGGLRRIPYLESQHANDDSLGWGHRIYTKSGFMNALPDEFVDAAVDHVTAAPAGEDVFSIWAFGGAIGRVPEDATAFAGRSAPYWIGAEAMWDDAGADDAHLAWGRSAIDLTEPWRLTGSYVNDVTESGDEALVRSVYGDAKYDRLVALKRAWDPDNVFRLNQNIRP